MVGRPDACVRCLVTGESLPRGCTERRLRVSCSPGRTSDVIVDDTGKGRYRVRESVMAKRDVSTYNEDGVWKSKVEGSARAAHTGGTKAEQAAVGKKMA